MANNPNNLLPCPFCGEQPVLTKHFQHDDYSFMHRCSVLGPISRDFCPPELHVKRWNTRVALAGPVPPAGVEPVPVRPYAPEEDQSTMTDYEIGLGHGACEMWDKFQPHVTRLQAEVDRLKRVLEAHRVHRELAFVEQDAVQSELTKARELLVEWCEFGNSPGDTPLHEMHRKAKDLVARSAPAAKDVCGTCNGTKMVDDGEITCSAVGIPFENGPIKCVKDCPECATADQPAPVAVVLPERKHYMHQGLSHTDAKSDGWNACLDELKRLNPAL